MGEFGKCSRDPLGGRSLDTELGIQQYAADLVDQAASDDPVSGYSATEVPGSLWTITCRRVQAEPQVSR